ncbi:hypothetical protein SAMN05518849_103310 [Sphingobium sp. AP50]|uniref:hypothetical protein n=1 Tax=Sphingobium sp. AP50 TaxID=1884369 RepID=UPI0008CB3F80|nr:hypothetical protein [Sphingobium sp. AP50]SEJ19467.1 hypothetical protein SAMN05518849_103310 [Sphingobium sp. AP50]
MKGARIIAWVVIAIMGVNMANVAINSGMDHGVGFDTFLAGSGDPWQLFINNDLVTGLLFMAGWLIFREWGGRLADRIVWVWMIMWWGNIVVAAYVLLALWQSGGDDRRFFMGRREGALPTLRIGVVVRVPSGGMAALVAFWTLAGIVKVDFAPIATFGFVMGFAPVILSLLLIAWPSRSAAAA